MDSFNDDQKKILEQLGLILLKLVKYFCRKAISNKYIFNNMDVLSIMLIILQKIAFRLILKLQRFS